MFDDLVDVALEAELCSQAAHVTAGECRLVLLVGEFDRREAWVGQGLRSCAHWLNWRVGTSLGAAREQVRVGRALEALPHARAAFESGELSYSKVRAITRVASAELEEHLVELARHATASQLEQLVREYRKADPDEATTAQARHEQRYVRTWTDDDGMLVISARLSPEDGAVVLAALEAATAAFSEGSGAGEAASPEPSPDVPAETCPETGPDVPTETSPEPGPDVPAETCPETGPDVPAETCHIPDVPAETCSEPGPDVPAETSEHLSIDDPWSEESSLAELALEDRLQVRETSAADALVALCASVLARGLSEEIEDSHVSVVVHVDEPVLSDPSAHGCAHIEGLGAITGHAAARLACDGAVSKVRFRIDGSIEPHGATRVIPRTMRRALLARDRGCRWPGCTTRRFLHAHHVVFWSRGGPTALSNLVAPCGAHHRLVHEGGWSLQLHHAGTLRVSSPDGIEVPAVPGMRPADGDGLAAANDRLGLDIGSDTLSWGGERIDIGLTVDGLLSVVGRNA
jgi:phosphoglycolate phosphatase-like HAD superfamily hydrolase